MSMLKKIAWGALALLISCLLLFVGPGVYERLWIDKLISNNAPLEAYISKIGNPSSVFRSYEEFKDSYANKVFKLAKPKEEMHYIYWAKEGLPYYWVLLIQDAKNEKIEAAKIRIAW